MLILSSDQSIERRTEPFENKIKISCYSFLLLFFLSLSQQSSIDYVFSCCRIYQLQIVLLLLLFYAMIQNRSFELFVCFFFLYFIIFLFKNEFVCVCVCLSVGR